MSFFGFSNGKRSTISSGDWDRDGVKNLRDCNAMNWRKQDGGEPYKRVHKTNWEIEKDWDTKVERRREIGIKRLRTRIKNLNEKISKRNEQYAKWDEEHQKWAAEHKKKYGEEI